jgi:hypothetical protein
MRRLLWLGVGLAVGAVAVRKLTQKAQTYTPAGLAHRVSVSAGGLVESVRSFVDDVRDGMAEREAEIHQAFVDGSLYEPDELDDDDPDGIEAIERPITGNGHYGNVRPERFGLRQDQEGNHR